MRISFVSALTLDTDMHKTRELEIIKALAERGHTTTLIAITSKSNFKMSDQRIKLIPIPIRSVPIISPLIWAGVLLFFLPIHILVSKPDFVIMDPEISVLSSIPTRLALRFSKAKFVLDVRSTPVEVIGFRGHLLEFLFNVSVLVAKRFFKGMAFVTSSMKQEVCRKFGLDQNKVCVWTNGVSLNLFEPQNFPEESAKLKKQLDLTKKFIVFYHGAFSPTRGLTQTIEAIQIVSQQNPQIVLLLLGTGPIVSDLEKLIRLKSLQNNVVLHDPVLYEEVPKFIGLSDVCIVPLPNNSYWRFQNALNLLEYLAMEKVVLATDIYANRVVAGDEKCCIYFQSVDPVEIANSIEYAYVNKDKLDGLGKVGRKIIQSSYTWEKVAEEVEHYLLSVDSRYS